MKNLTVIVYDDELLKAFKVQPLNFAISEDETIEFKYIDDLGGVRTAYVPGIKQPKIAQVEIGEITATELDPTAMKRIARYNLEKANEVLTKEIDFKEAKLKHLTEQFERQQKRLSDLQKVMKQFIESDCDTVSEMFGVD